MLLDARPLAEAVCTPVCTPACRSLALLRMTALGWICWMQARLDMLDASSVGPNRDLDAQPCIWVIWDILDHFGTFWDHLGNFGSICVILGQFVTIGDPVEILGTIGDLFLLCRLMQSRLHARLQAWGCMRDASCKAAIAGRLVDAVHLVT